MTLENTGNTDYNYLNLSFLLKVKTAFEFSLTDFFCRDYTSKQWDTNAAL